MARGKLPAAERFYDAGCRFKRLKGPKGLRFSISVRMPADGEHDGWWWSRPRRVELSAPNDKRELLQLADDYRAELLRVQAAPPTVSEYVDRWRERRAALVKAGNLKQATVDREGTTLAHICDYLGDIPLPSLTHDDITQAYAKMALDGMSMSTRARVNVKLRQVLAQAMREGLIDGDPLEQAAPDELPRMPQRDAARYEERRVTIEEADALMSSIRQEPRSGLNAAVWLAYMMGLRRGECLGLRWSDIDEKAGTVTIERQMTRQGVTDPKTYKSARVLPLTPPVWAYLKSWRDEQIKMFDSKLPVRDGQGRVKGLKKKTWSMDTYICCNADGEGWPPNGNLNRGLRSFFVRHGLGEYVVGDDGRRHYHGATLHALRHTYVTSLIRDGADVRSVQALAGHANIQTTLAVYSDETEQGKREAALKHARHVMTPGDEAAMLQDAGDLERLQQDENE